MILNLKWKKVQSKLLTRAEKSNKYSSIILFNNSTQCALMQTFFFLKNHKTSGLWKPFSQHWFWFFRHKQKKKNHSINQGKLVPEATKLFQSVHVLINRTAELRPRYDLKSVTIWDFRSLEKNVCCPKLELCTVCCVCQHAYCQGFKGLERMNK